MSETLTPTTGTISETRTPPKRGTAATELYFGGTTGAGLLTVATTATNPWVQGVALVGATAIAIAYMKYRTQAKVNGEIAESTTEVSQ